MPGKSALIVVKPLSELVPFWNKKLKIKNLKLIGQISERREKKEKKKTLNKDAIIVTTLIIGLEFFDSRKKGNDLFSERS